MKLPDNSFLVFASQKWNASGITLKAGTTYRIAPVNAPNLSQEWEDSFITCGPEGWDGAVGKFSSEAFRKLLRVRNLDGADVRYFSLIGCLGKSLESAFLIGAGTDFTPRKTGQLFAFANDAEFAYGNNHGQVAVSVVPVS